MQDKGALTSVGGEVGRWHYRRVNVSEEGEYIADGWVNSQPRIVFQSSPGSAPWVWLKRFHTDAS